MPNYTEEVRYFDLGAILSITTFKKLVDNSKDYQRIVYYAFNTTQMGPLTFELLSVDVRQHILNIHPELEGIDLEPGEDPDEFVKKQKAKFGDKLPITRLNKPLIPVQDQSTTETPISRKMTPSKN